MLDIFLSYFSVAKTSDVYLRVRCKNSNHEPTTTDPRYLLRTGWKSFSHISRLFLSPTHPTFLSPVLGNAALFLKPTFLLPCFSFHLLIIYRPSWVLWFMNRLIPYSWLPGAECLKYPVYQVLL